MYSPADKYCSLLAAPLTASVQLTLVMEDVLLEDNVGEMDMLCVQESTKHCSLKHYSFVMLFRRNATPLYMKNLRTVSCEEAIV